jgi:hypothetical protein
MAGGSSVANGNPKVKTFTSFAGLAKWITSSVTLLHSVFASAAAMNVDLNGWDVSKVKDFSRCVPW